MSAPSATVMQRLGALNLPALVMVGLAINALMAGAMANLAAGGGVTLTLGLSPFQIVALLVAAKFSLVDDGDSNATTPLWLDGLAVALVLVPSSSVSWGALALYSAYVAWQSSGERRTGALIFFGVALASVWSSVILKWIAVPVTTAEAFVFAQVLQLFRPDILQVGNVVGNPDTHSLILMTRCTTADALPHAAVALVAVAYLLGDVDTKRLWRACAILAVIYATANIARLCGMAWSSEAYQLIHGPIGANVFDLFQAGLVLVLGNWVGQR